MSAEWPKVSKRDILRALQACYYVLHISIVTDTEFDELEKEYEEATDKRLPVGSDQKDTYTDTEWSLALYFAMRHAWLAQGFKGADIPAMKEKLNPKQAHLKSQLIPKNGKG
jgi:NAD-dependent DNA ligase